MNEEIVKCSMDMILNAGDAREECFKALKEMAAFNFEAANKKMEEARNAIIKAHQIHTNYLQESIQKESNEYSVLFAHAQDTLMTVNTEINLSENLLNVFEELDRRISKLEA